MAADIVPALLADIKADFERRVDGDDLLKRIAARVRNGTASLEDAHDYAVRLGEALSESLVANLTEGALPDGKLYWNIADRTIRPMLENSYDLTNQTAAEILRIIDEAENIGLSPVRSELPTERIHGLMDKAVGAGDFNAMQAWLMEPIINCTEAFFDDFVQANADARHRAGMSPKIVRTATGGCCAWCAKLAGSYEYGSEVRSGDDVFRRHERCRCVVTFKNGKERQNVWSKELWTDDGETLERRRAFNRDIKTHLADAQNRWTAAQEDGTIGRAERFALRIAANPKMLSAYTPKGFKAALENAGFDVRPLGDGAFKGVAFEDGGGFRVNFGDGGVIMYHPAERSHHSGAYYKISTGKGGKHRYDVTGAEKEP